MTAVTSVPQLLSWDPLARNDMVFHYNVLQRFIVQHQAHVAAERLQGILYRLHQGQQGAPATGGSTHSDGAGAHSQW